MPRKGEGKRIGLLKDPDVRRWFDNLRNGSASTADNYLRVFGLFLEEHSLTPKQFVKMNEKKRDDLLADHLNMMLAKGKAGSYAAVVKKAAVSWLDWNGYKLTRNIKIKGSNWTPRLRDACIPSQEQLADVMNVSDAKVKTIVAFMAFSGCREEILGDYQGEDGLRLRDLPELKIESGKVIIEKTPMRVIIRERLSKTGRSYFTFLGQEGCRYLTSYLMERISHLKKGEEFSADSPVVTRKDRTKPFIRTNSIGDSIRKSMRKVGLKESPYIWRSYFASRSMLAESKGLLRDYRVFFMGHKGDIEHTYALHKIVPPDTVEAMRKAYESALQYLETMPKASKDESAREIISFLLIDKGFSEEEIEKMELGEKSKAELVDILKKGPKAELKQNENHMQKVISIQDLPRALDEGWAFKATLPDGRAIVENGYQNGDNGRIPFREK